MQFPILSEQYLIDRLEWPKGKVRMVLDTDTYNEVDDQFALAYALKSGEKIDLQAIYAAPFHNERSSGPREGMEHLVHSPIVTDQLTWGFNRTRHLIRSAYYINRDSIFGDLFKKLQD